MVDTVTIAARRIARTLNSTPPEVTLAFGAEGHSVESWSTGMTHIGGFDHTGVAVVASGRRRERVTQREIQDLLDSWAAADAAGERGSAEWSIVQFGYLEDLVAVTD